MPVPLFDPDSARRPLRAELRAATHRVLDSGAFILGPEVEAFEREFAAYLGARHAIGVANGTEAITVALRALGVGPGDEVVVPSFTFWASAEAIPPTGATPVFCDVDPTTFLVTPATVKAALTPRTKAVVAVHLFGNVAPVVEIEALGVPVLEDAAQAAGSTSDAGRPGALGTIATFSFYPSKNLGAFGDGGAVTTDDAALAERLRSLRNYGSSAKYVNRERGFNSRLDELQAAMLSEKLVRLDAWNARRRAIAHRYLEGLAGLPLALPADGPGHAWHVFAVHTPERDALAAHLAGEGVGTLVHYPIPPHLQDAYRDLGIREGDLPVAERLARETLSLPMGPHLAPGDADRVVAAVRGFLGADA